MSPPGNQQLRLMSLQPARSSFRFPVVGTVCLTESPDGRAVGCSRAGVRWQFRRGPGGAKACVRSAGPEWRALETDASGLNGRRQGAWGSSAVFVPSRSGLANRLRIFYSDVIGRTAAGAGRISWHSVGRSGPVLQQRPSPATILGGFPKIGARRVFCVLGLGFLLRFRVADLAVLRSQKAATRVRLLV